MPTIKLNLLICLVLYMATTLCFSLPKKPTQPVFNPMDFEAYGDGENDDSQALMDAFQAACDNNGPATFLIPKDTTFLAGPMTFEGPCYTKRAPTVKIMGTVLATPNAKDYSDPGWIVFRHLDKLVISGGGTLDGQGAQAWKTNSCSQGRRCNAITLRLVTVFNAIVADLTIKDSKGFHVAVQRSSNVTVRHLRISAPEDSPNTDGVHISKSDLVKLTNLTIATGDDCVSIGPGSTHIFMHKITCGPGHGISIGSLGKYPKELDVLGIHVKNCSIKNTQNGVRIKSWPGSQPSKASNITFENIVMKNVSNAIIIDQQYCPDGQCKTHAPSLVKLSYIRFRNISGTSNEKLLVNLLCSPALPCQNVLLDNIDLHYVPSLDTDHKSLATTDSVIAGESNCSNVKGRVVGKQNPKSCI